MPKQSGIFKIEGKIDEILFYKRKGSYFTRKAPKGPSREQLLTNPKYARTRENISEFAALSIGASSFFKAISKASNFKDGTLFNRLITLSRRVIKNRHGVAGKRTLDFYDRKELFIQLEFNANIPFTSLFKNTIVKSHTEGRNEGNVVVRARHIKDIIHNTPVGATHVRFVQLIGLVANTMYDEGVNKYVPVNVYQNGMHEITYSDYINLDDSGPVDLHLQTHLSEVHDVNNGVCVIQCMGLTFDQKIGNHYYPLKDGNAMMIVDVF